MNIKTTVGHVAVVGEDPGGRPSGILVDERAFRSARARRRGNLYAVIEISGAVAGRVTLAEQMLEGVHNAYYSHPGSVTAALQDSIRAANDWLFQENRDSLPGEQRTAGISCAVLRDEDLFLAQAGPSAAYLTQGGRVTRYPEASAWLGETPVEEWDTTALGGRRDLNVSLYHSQVGPGDVILLAESALASALPTRTLPRILANPSVEEVLEDLIAAGGGAERAALVIQIGEVEAAEGAPEAGLRARTAPSRAEPGIEAAGAEVWRLRIRDWLERAGRVLAPVIAAVGAALMTLLRRILPDQMVAPARPAAQQRRRAGASVRARGREREASRPWWEPLRKPWVALAFGIPALVALIVLVMVIGRSGKQKADLEALWQDASGAWERAGTATGAEVIRTELGAAEGALSQLLERQPENADAKALLGQVQARLDEVNSIQRPTWVAKLTSYPAGARPGRVVVEGEHVFVLDRAGGRVYHHRLDRLQQALQPDTVSTVLVAKGQTVGSVLVGDLVDLVWMPAGTNRLQATLLILESGGALLQYDPSTAQLDALPIAEPAPRVNPRLVGSHTGRFYVLDPGANKLWRYTPTPEGHYNAAPESWLQIEANLPGVVDMAVGDEIYLLYADGDMRRFKLGNTEQFELTGWPGNPEKVPGAMAIFTRPEDESVFVADLANARIVQFTLAGAFERQFKLPGTPTGGRDALSEVTSLFVNSINAQAFFTSGQDLYMVVLPTRR